MTSCFKIKEMRERRGITQAQFAALTGVRQNTVSQWESGKRHPSSLLLSELADVLGCTVDELLGRGREGRREEDSLETI